MINKILIQISILIFKYLTKISIFIELLIRLTPLSFFKYRISNKSLFYLILTSFFNYRTKIPLSRIYLISAPFFGYRRFNKSIICLIFFNRRTKNFFFKNYLISAPSFGYRKFNKLIIYLILFNRRTKIPFFRIYLIISLSFKHQISIFSITCHYK
jgi:hypothetical protein